MVIDLIVHRKSPNLLQAVAVMMCEQVYRCILENITAGFGLYSLNSTDYITSHIMAWAKWLVFSRRHFQMHFRQEKNSSLIKIPKFCIVAKRAMAWHRTGDKQLTWINVDKGYDAMHMASLGHNMGKWH